MTVKQTHKGHEIYFNETSEEWVCDAFGLANKSLKTIRSAIDRADKKQRSMAVPALYLPRSYWEPPELSECMIVLLRTDGRSNAHIKIKGRDDTDRVELEELYPLSERKKLEAYMAVQKQVFEANKKAEALQEKLVPFTPEKLREAIVQQADEAA